MPVIFAPDQLPANTRYYMDDFHGLGSRYVDVFRFASPQSECLGILADYELCKHAAIKNNAAVVTTNVFASYGSRELLGSRSCKVYIIPAPLKYHTLYLNLIPYMLCRGAYNSNGQLVLPSALVEELMEHLACLWKKDVGFTRNHTLYFHPQIARDNLYKIELIQKKLSDFSSKHAFARFVYSDPFEQFEYSIINLFRKIQYFDYLCPQPGGVIINCGVDNGWELPFFISTMGADAKIYNIDPTGNDNLSDYSALFCNSELCSNMLSFHRAAVWDCCAELVFNNNTVRERVDSEEKEGDFVVGATTIDSFCEKNLIDRVDIIKMDLEGSEPRAIRGMMKTVARYRPQLGICVYHGIDQAINIPYMLIHELKDYNFYFDTYFVDTGESVFYCIPKEVDARPSLPIVLEPVLDSAKTC